jgi:hypothetical protein
MAEHAFSPFVLLQDLSATDASAATILDLRSSNGNAPESGQNVNCLGGCDSEICPIIEKNM